MPNTPPPPLPPLHIYDHESAASFSPQYDGEPLRDPRLVHGSTGETINSPSYTVFRDVNITQDTSTHLTANTLDNNHTNHGTSDDTSAVSVADGDPERFVDELLNGGGDGPNTTASDDSFDFDHEAVNKALGGIGLPDDATFEPDYKAVIEAIGQINVGTGKGMKRLRCLKEIVPGTPTRPNLKCQNSLTLPPFVVVLGHYRGDMTRMKDSIPWFSYIWHTQIKKNAEFIADLRGCEDDQIFATAEKKIREVTLQKHEYESFKTKMEETATSWFGAEAQAYFKALKAGFIIDPDFSCDLIERMDKVFSSWKENEKIPSPVFVSDSDNHDLNTKASGQKFLKRNTPLGSKPSKKKDATTLDSKPPKEKHALVRFHEIQDTAIRKSVRTKVVSSNAPSRTASLSVAGTSQSAPTLAIATTGTNNDIGNSSQHTATGASTTTADGSTTTASTTHATDEDDIPSYIRAVIGHNKLCQKDYVDIHEAFLDRMNLALEREDVRWFRRFMKTNHHLKECLHLMRMSYDKFVEQCGIDTEDDFYLRKIWAKDWADAMYDNKEWAKWFEKCRSSCLSLLYAGYDLCQAKKVDILSDEGLGWNGIDNILFYCLPLDRANCLYMMSDKERKLRGLGWYSKQHVSNSEWEYEFNKKPALNRRLYHIVIDHNSEMFKTKHGHWINPAIPPRLEGLKVGPEEMKKREQEEEKKKNKAQQKEGEFDGLDSKISSKRPRMK